MYDTTTAKSKAIFYFKDGNTCTFYSTVREDSKGQQQGINGLVRRLVLGKFKGKYKTALICDATTGQQLQKFVNDKEIKL